MTTSEIEQIEQLAAKPIIADEHELVSVRKDHLRELLKAYTGYASYGWMSAFVACVLVSFVWIAILSFVVGRH